MSLSRFVGLLLLSCLQPMVAVAADESDWFRERIEPLLKQHCFECHSHNGKLSGGLTLDSRSGWQKGGDSGAAVIPSKPDESLLIKAIRHTYADLKMPPEKKLSDAEIKLFEEWVQRGAVDPRVLEPSRKMVSTDWWATKPLSRPQKMLTPGREIDELVQARLTAEGLQLATKADRRKLLRRVTFDLWGLPPSVEELHQFEQDVAPNAWEKVIDRLLSSPRYGERFARHWLDIVHFGESHGFGMDLPRHNAWHYRDYLIEAFNNDKPYARFVQEQIAADVLFPQQTELIPALGFLASGPFNQSALVEQVDGTECKQIALNLDRDDMLSNMATTFLSITLHCSRCHDHKFDPLTQTDYYRLQSVFAGVVRGDRDFDPQPEISTQRARWQDVRAKLEAKGDLNEVAPEVRDMLLAKMNAWRKNAIEQETQWKTPEVEIKAESAETLVVKQPDGSYRFEGKLAENDTYTVALLPTLETVTGLRLDVLSDDTLPHKGPGRQPSNGNLTVTELKVSAIPSATPDQPRVLKIGRAVADFNQAQWEVSKALDGNPGTGWGIHPQEGRSHAAVFEFAEPVRTNDLARFVIRIEQTSGRSHLIGRLKLALTGLPKPADSVPPSPDQRRVFAEQAQNEVTGPDSVILWKSVGPRLVEEFLQALPPKKTVWAIGPQIPALRNYRPPATPYPIHILQRGDVRKPLALVTPGGLQHLSTIPADFVLPTPQEGERRAALARWLTDDRNSLTWRSIANRVWRWHFGTGIVPTANDFGRMGGSPSHPELLDWLASDLRAHGSLKTLHRKILLSETYQQSVTIARSAASDGIDPASKDADNRLLWRQNRQRLDSEQLRDALLAVSDRLDLTLGGPSVMQFNMKQHDPLRSPVIDYDGFDPDSPASRRRGVYRFLFRNINDPLLESFDAVDPSLSTPQRAETTTPLQALSLFNNRFVLRHCEHLAERLQKSSPEVRDQVRSAYELLFGRLPSDAEIQSVSVYVAQHGLANACRVLVNCNEFLFVD